MTPTEELEALKPLAATAERLWLSHSYKVMRKLDYPNGFEVVPRDPSLDFGNREYLAMANVQFFVVRPGDSHPNPKSACERNRGAVTLDSCDGACVALFDWLQHQLKNNPLVAHVQGRVGWCKTEIRPRSFFFYDYRVGNEPDFPEHDFLVISTHSNSEFVLDLSAWQFGLGKTFFTWQEYSQFREGRLGIRNPGEEIRKFGEYEGRWCRWALELRERLARETVPLIVSPDQDYTDLEYELS